MQMLLTGDPVSAQQALRANLVNAVGSSEKVLEKAEENAHRIARHPLLAIRIEMEASLRGMDMTHNEALDYVKTLYRMQRLTYGGGEERVEQFLYTSDGSRALD
jgi:enoyl-CoA hydratase/carnithine racemase